MASRDRFSPQPRLETITLTPEASQGELFARLLLRQLPIMKHGPEDDWAMTTPATMH